ncbi:MAG: hypothetical protein R6W91_06090 [Thermoplasmata archaeon]
MVLKERDGEIVPRTEAIRPFGLMGDLDSMFEETIQSRKLMPLISNPKTAVCSNSSPYLLINMLETAIYEIASNVPLNRDSFGNNPIYPPPVLSSKYGGNEIPYPGEKILPNLIY